MMALEFGIPGEAAWPLWPFVTLMVAGGIILGYLWLADRCGWWPFKHKP